MSEMREVDIGRRGWMKLAGLGVTGSAWSAGGRLARAGQVSGVGRVRGVVFLVSDGMSPGVLTLSQAFSKLTRQRGTAWWDMQNRADATRGLMDTASANSLVTDSAAASTAWGGGQRVNNGSINVTPDGRELVPIMTLLKSKGRVRTGLVTTATVTHATPAGFGAVAASRSSEVDIAPQYLGRVDVILGGGSGFFESKERPDGRDLRGDFRKAGYEVVSSRDGLLAAKAPRLLGTFSRGHLPFSIDRSHDVRLSAGIPTLEEMTRAALARFLEGEEPFLLQVEGARIDHAAHLNDIGALLGDQLAFDDALRLVLSMTAAHPDVLVVATSDHGNSNPGLNGMGSAYGESTPKFGRIAGFKASHERIFAEWSRRRSDDAADLVSLVRGYLDFSLGRHEAEALLKVLRRQPVVEWNHQLEKPEGLLGQFAGNHTGIGWTGTTHTADPTLVTAVGPQADRFGGMVVNSDVFGHLVEMLGRS